MFWQFASRGLSVNPTKVYQQRHQQNHQAMNRDSLTWCARPLFSSHITLHRITAQRQQRRGAEPQIEFLTVCGPPFFELLQQHPIHIEILEKFFLIVTEAVGYTLMTHRTPPLSGFTLADNLIGKTGRTAFFSEKKVIQRRSGCWKRS